ncbi:MAG: hypothetical protein E7668_01340 [Ruminococcaceae bacterium]|nr:hypothetical protein [Oscillospiraceae bacterium]
MSTEAQNTVVYIGEEAIKETDIRYCDVRKKPFDLYGFYNPQTESELIRLPHALAEVSEGVRTHYKHSAGARVRFCTDSSYVVIRGRMTEVGRHPVITFSCTAGFDLYRDEPQTERSVFCAGLMPSSRTTDGFALIHRFPDRRLRYLTLYLPMHSALRSLEIGLQEDAAVGEGMPYRNTLPVVFYGSSITQGVSASRAGNSYVSMISRRYNMNVLNLGLAGSCKAEDPIVDHLSTLSMSAFVSDYDYNAPSVEYLRNTHCKMYQKIRGAHPDIPYIMISRPNFSANSEDNANRRDVIMNTYRYAREQGDKNVYYIDGESFFKGEWEDSCTVDGVHPNDLGFHFMAEKIGNTLGKLILS